MKEKPTNDGRRMTGNRARCALLALVTLLTLVLDAQGQDKEAVFITFRQRLLQQKHDDNIEKIDSFSKLHLMIAGNIYQTEKHAAYAYDKTTGKYDYKSELKYIQPLLNLGDITIANLKTSFSNDAKNMFSSPDEFGLALKYAGINALMHANVHIANISKATLKRTDDVLDAYDIFHTGAFMDNIQRNGNYPLIMNRKGFKIAILNYTNLTSRPSQSREFVINEADRTVMDRDMRLVHAYKPDFTIVYFDWGANMQDLPSMAQQELAQYVFQAGANLVVGTHPNTPMRIDLMNYTYNGVPREGIIAYSLGNLISSNEEIRNRNGYIIDMELRKNNFTRETSVNDWGIIPVYTYYDTVTIPGRTKVWSVPCSNIESGDIFPTLPYIEKRRAVNSAYTVRKLLGNTADEIQYNLNELIVNNVEESIDITNAPLNNKFNPKREQEVEPSPAPELPVSAGDGTLNTPSLALLYEEPTPPAAGNTSKGQKKTEKENSYQAQRKKAEAVLDGAPVKEHAKAEAINVSPTSTGQISAVDPKLTGTTDIAKMENVETDRDSFYRIQFYALKTYIPLDTNYYTHLKGYDIWPEDGLYKYFLGRFKNYAECEQYWKSQILPRYRQSFIVKFVNGKKVK
jgi:poly-gamma-glutamate synthesis protein (capsule biosynthesis protein)